MVSVLKEEHEGTRNFTGGVNITTTNALKKPRRKFRRRKYKEGGDVKGGYQNLDPLPGYLSTIHRYYPVFIFKFCSTKSKSIGFITESLVTTM
jgi:hypothetical protein